MFTLGTELEEMTVPLTDGADFNSILESEDGPWPDGISIELRFGRDPWAPDFTWTAEVEGNLATFLVDKTLVREVLAAGTRQARLWNIDGTADICWAAGSVVVQ